MKYFATISLLFIGLFASHIGKAQQQSTLRPICLSDGGTQYLRSNGLSKQGQPSAEKTLHEGEPEFTFVIPVVFHIMTDGGPELDVDLAQCQSQIDVLNEDFGRFGNGFNSHPDGINAKIKFCLASKDPDGNFTIGMDTFQYAFTSDHNPFTPGMDSAMKAPVVWDVERYMNVYVVRSILSGNNSGYAYFPGDVYGTILDGLVLDYRHIGRTGTATGNGRTGTHEVGHYLDLYHPWGLVDTLCGSPTGDYCDDTPEVPFTYFSLAPSCFKPPTCLDGVMRQVENYMDYSDDECMNMFTFCQSQRMRNALTKYRGKLVSSENLASLGCSDIQNGEPSTEEYIIYPNPASEVVMVFVDFEDENPVSIELYDFSGRMVVKVDPAGIGRGAIPVDVSGLEMGAYHLVIRMES